MGASSSAQERKASLKSDAIQDKMEKQKNETNVDQQGVRESVKEHEDSQRKRCRSVVSLGARDQGTGINNQQSPSALQPQDQININRALKSAIQSPQVKTSPKINFPRPSKKNASPTNQELESAEAWLGSPNRQGGPIRKRDQGSSPNSPPRHQNSVSENNSEQSNEDRAYQEMLNEAIIQSVLEQSKLDGKDSDQLSIPSKQDEENMLKEVLKMSALEYQKASGQMHNLDFLKRNKRAKKEKEIVRDQNLIMGELSDQQLAQIAKQNAPRKLGEIKPFGAKKPIDSFRLVPLELQKEQQSPKHMESSATMMQSIKTNDNTADIMNPSMAQLNNREIDEDSILRDVMGDQQNKQSTTILTSNKKSHINEQDQKKSPTVNNDEIGDTLLNSKDFDVSKSPGKIDMDIEKMMDELGGINPDDEWA